MALKSYRFKSKKRTKRKKKRRSGSRDIITGGVTAVVGTALVAETASAVRRI